MFQSAQLGSARCPSFTSFDDSTAQAKTIYLHDRRLLVVSGIESRVNVPEMLGEMVSPETRLYTLDTLADA
jgi:hypothetical protein